MRRILRIFLSDSFCAYMSYESTYIVYVNMHYSYTFYSENVLPLGFRF